jgi:hypothetical protein
MKRIALGLSLLAVLMLVYSASPVVGWAALAAAATLLVTSRARQARPATAER